jgi:hypothetical protein
MWRASRFTAFILVVSVAHALAVPPNATAALVQSHERPTVNISFIKEVTLSVQPQDFELTPQDQLEVSSFLSSGLRLLDPIMRFFDGLVGGWSPPAQGQPDTHTNV